MEEAKLLWAQGQQPMALRLAQSLLNKLGVQGVLPTLQSELSVVNAKWLAQSRHVLCFPQIGESSRGSPKCAALARELSTSIEMPLIQVSVH